ncbi:hypothetical protein CDL12_05643 [Handroanthus impetiginosus]|uniref:Hydroxyproline-rich glycoprotein family protein n=1 Tax=Handroanthus impetiginosus TaxID=429701 RepID=A0A2G9HVV1_9LAMI|nr:hypothetical protein CDL12_05643 [Handroanthus impetiginosus]
MESPYHGGAQVSHSEGSRPSLGFPLGTALLLVVIFSLSGIFSCCYHWDKLRRSFSLPAAADLEAAADIDPSKPKPPHMDLKQKANQSLPVIMPGDDVPKFIALPCPCQPPRQLGIAAEVKKPPPKPPRIAVPLY